jgi:hypothetical protein
LTNNSLDFKTDLHENCPGENYFPAITFPTGKTGNELLVTERKGSNLELLKDTSTAKKKKKVILQHDASGTHRGYAGLGDVAQAVEHLPSKCYTSSSNPSAAKTPQLMGIYFKITSSLSCLLLVLSSFSL